MACDGQRRLAEVLSATPIPSDLDKPAFHSLCLAAFKDLIAGGYVTADTTSQGAPETREAAGAVGT